MNRIQHLKQTLHKNILANRDYPNLEFIILDYNSNDGLGNYIKDCMKNELFKEKVIFYRTVDPIYFNRSHSRNVVFKLASGEIVVNLDADNFTGSGFAAYVNREFNENKDFFLSSISSFGMLNKSDMLGRICLKKDDFFSVGGYDEQMTNYGFEDIDLVNRLQFYGLKNIPIDNGIQYLQAISHTSKKRINNEFPFKNLHLFLILYRTPSSSVLLFLFKNYEFKIGTVIKNQPSDSSVLSSHKFKVEKNISLAQYDFGLLDDQWYGGKWENNDTGFKLNYDNDKVQLFRSKKGSIFNVINTSEIFCKISNKKMIVEAIMFFSQITNRLIMQNNYLKTRVVTNVVFGKASLCKNFDTKEKIDI